MLIHLGIRHLPPWLDLGSRTLSPEVWNLHGSPWVAAPRAVADCCRPGSHHWKCHVSKVYLGHNQLVLYLTPGSGIFIASWFQDRYGYRHTIQISLVLMTAFIFVVFFSTSIEMLFVGELLCGIPWGAFSSVSIFEAFFTVFRTFLTPQSAVSYASEVAPLCLRGYMTTYINLCWVIGKL